MSTFTRSHLSLITEGFPADHGDPTSAWTFAPAYDGYAADSAPSVFAAELPAGAWTDADADAGEEAWRLDALCAETDPEAFFPEKGGSTREAKRVCTGCTVRAECLEFALASDERFGIWGGLSERERRRVRLQRRDVLTA
ncbi:WhiB family transcriptional regulator [Trujillella endophytica]|uniref:Transcriptional regulator WhiB n=1 Tax=Trujillonella endophytica TaxID=673521 RepID=A0A1H8Q2A9_9ACTN|nr:WhiB family transcriptional regulator [Trujillella endophytica]SEO48382.1 transcription factor WhiB [Trujillella endophytica]